MGWLKLVEFCFCYEETGEQCSKTSDFVSGGDYALLSCVYTRIDGNTGDICPCLKEVLSLYGSQYHENTYTDGKVEDEHFWHYTKIKFMFKLVIYN